MEWTCRMRGGVQSTDLLLIFECRIHILEIYSKACLQELARTVFVCWNVLESNDTHIFQPHLSLQEMHNEYGNGE